MSKVELWLSINGSSEIALAIPLLRCQELAVNPLKWLRYLGYIIYGQEGYLSTSDAGPDIGDYTTGLEARAYYFISQGLPRFADVEAINDRTSAASSELSVHRADFRHRIITRDGTCVSTGEIPEWCIACHIIPHFKGNDYIENALSYHSSGLDDINDIDDIDDTRNGLLLYSAAHGPLGTGALAPLKTPNFGLTVDDIPYNPPRQGNEPSPTSRLTWHYIESQMGLVFPNIIPNNSDLRAPEDTSGWPPVSLCNLFYASAAMKEWSPRSFIKTISAEAKDIYYAADRVTSVVQMMKQPGLVL